MKLKNKTILITGGTSGIGYELGKILLEKGNTVILMGRDREKMASAEEDGFGTVSCDLTSGNAIENAVLQIQNQYGKLDVLFNNAGIQYNYLFHEETDPSERIRKEVEVNLTSQIILTQQVLPLLSNASEALIVNTTSGLGTFPKMDALVYSATKSGMKNFTTGLRYLLKDSAIRVIDFIPPVTDTGMTEKREEKKMDAGELAIAAVRQIEKGRSTVTVPSLRIFRWIAFLWPGLAYRILSK